LRYPLLQGLVRVCARASVESLTCLTCFSASEAIESASDKKEGRKGVNALSQLLTDNPTVTQDFFQELLLGLATTPIK